MQATGTYHLSQDKKVYIERLGDLGEQLKYLMSPQA
jgi:hypothetical protein